MVAGFCLVPIQANSYDNGALKKFEPSLKASRLIIYKIITFDCLYFNVKVLKNEYV